MGAVHSTCTFLKKQTKFDNLKPFFVKQAKKDRPQILLVQETCQNEFFFNAWMKFRKAAVINSDQSIPVPKTLTEWLDLTLCPKEDGASYNTITCLKSECYSCGVDGFALLPEEMSNKGLVHWYCYEYVSTRKFLHNGQEKKKISSKRGIPIPAVQSF